LGISVRDACSLRNAAIRKQSPLLIGKDEHGNPLPNPDEAEEERWSAADARGVLREAQALRQQAAERLADRNEILERAAADLERETAELRALEEVAAEGSRIAADDLTERLRAGNVAGLTAYVQAAADQP